MTAQAASEDWLFGEETDPRLKLSSRLVWTLGALFAAAVLWAWFATLDEVATGSGRVVPTMREQVIESLEGGIVAKLYVKQDDLVEAGQILAQLDPTQASSTFEESAAKYRAALAASARLQAEVNQTALAFPGELDEFPDLVRTETRLYETRRRSLNESVRLIDQSIALIRREVAIGESLIEVGAASNVEVIRLRRQLSELELKKADLRSQYLVEARQQLSEANEQVEALAPVMRGRSDTLSRLTLRSPVKGIVKSMEVSTVGGVIPPNGRLMEIIPLEDQLMIEARMSPRDIAFIHPGQRATVKVTAYDYSIYGGLEGEVATISPDTIQDEVNPEVYYYRVFIRTTSNALVNDAGESFPIVPGMITTVDVHTGQKTVLQYLMKPINRAQEALRER
ncbi:HlyD family type I secretion periplasmic adaptor subunit [Altererythrobacter sp. C41]|uniref:HlyD family type I secretion periplasmic adaptor subunit n=1 Tax=Altererythrobacter sp. C41 TaxID=2806021 RepID=UPI0019312B56|nr:HlyD family type I secretion periplasmic adaptor subunit [Altererythrobacter sp. C41]MBM0169289.1 HlyD family type I secretion periplasmic adaptor subunit [Altererythrobacter sp. C41]